MTALYADEFIVEDKEAGQHIARQTKVRRRLSRLEYMVRNEIITPRQFTAGTWVAERWEAFYSPASSSGIEDHAPGWALTDPLTAWTRGQRVYDRHNRKRTPPPTFRPRRPSDGRTASDGWTQQRLDAMQNWMRTWRMLEAMRPLQRQAVMLIAIGGLSADEAVRRMRGDARRPAGRQLRATLMALCVALDAIADEIEPRQAEAA